MTDGFRCIHLRNFAEVSAAAVVVRPASPSRGAVSIATSAGDSSCDLLNAVRMASAAAAMRTR
jgi:hypothetical protein